MTTHDDIDSYLVADLHNELSEQERNELHTHLVECATCRQFHQENKIMNKILEENLATEKADPTFEQRMLAGFRRTVRERRGLVELLVSFFRSRTLRFVAAAAVLLFTGVWLTGMRIGFLGNGDAMVDQMTRDDPFSLDVLRMRLSWSEQKAEEQEEQSKRAALAPPVPEPESAGTTEAAKRTQDVAAVTDAAPTSETGVSGRIAASEPQSKEEPAGKEKPTAEYEGGAPKLAMSAESTRLDTVGFANRKLIRNAKVDLEISSFEQAVQKITAFANEERGYVATSSSEKQANGKLSGEVVVKVLPENLDRFLQKIRGLGELKNQTLGTEDVTKAYFDTESRLKNAHVMEQRLIDMLKTKTGKVADLLAVEKELGRVREEIEKMQGELKYWDSQVQLATVTISLAEKDMEEPAAFLLKEHAQLLLYAPDVEKTYNDIKASASPKVQITNAQLDRDNSGRISAHISVLIAPEESDSVISKVKAMARVENFQVQTERVAQGGDGMSENAKTKRDKVELNISLSREEQEQAFQQTSLRIRTSAVDEKAKELRNLAEKQNGRIRSSSFSRDPNGREVAGVSLRVPMKNYAALMQSLGTLGKVEDVSVSRQDNGGQIDEANAPAIIGIQVYSQGSIVSSDTGLLATLRRTIAQGAAALMWSARMIGVALAFFAPWVVALIAVIWITKRIRARRKL